MNLLLKKSFALIALLLIGLAACSKDEPATEPASQAVEEAASEAPVADEAPADADDADVEAIVVVEESAAEPEGNSDEAIVLARADSPAAAKNYKFKEGTNYQRLTPSQPTVGGADKIEVAEFFWYGCPHCFDLEPSINKWAENKPANVRFVRIPAMWNGLVKAHAQLFYTEEILERNGVIKDPKAFRHAVFEEYRRGNRLQSEDAIRKFFARYGVSDEDFTKTWGSFEVAQKLRVAEDLARRYSISSVPTMVVNGKYRFGAADAGSYPQLIELIDELIDRESTR